MRIAGGRFKGRALPEARGARPAGARWKASLFSVLGPYLAGARILDLFAGAGTLGLEALSRGAAHVTLVERDRDAARRLERWIEAAGAGGAARVVCRDAWEGRLPAGPYEIAFADPPFAAWEDGRGAEVVARALALLVPGGVLVLKLPARRDPPADPRWRLVRREAVGSTAWAVLRASEGGPEDAPPASQAGPGPPPV